MSAGDLQSILVGGIGGLASSAVFLLALFIGFCVLVGLKKLKQTAGEGLVVKCLDESVSHRPTIYLPPTTPRGTTDQLHAPGTVGR